jgi:MFS family permease
MHWLQNGNVNHFATRDLRLVSIAPFASYAQMWVMGLAGNDLFLNFVQWISYVWSALVAGVISWRIFHNVIPTSIALLLVISMPMGIAESTTTQSDWVGAIWVVIAAALVAQRTTNGVSFRIYSAGLFLSAGLSAGTKTTALFATGLVILAAIFLELWRKEATWHLRLMNSIWISMISLLGALIGILPQAVRNVKTFGNVSGETFGLLNERFDAVTLAGNTLRIVIRNIGVPTQLSQYVNAQLPNLFDTLRIPWIDPFAVGYEHLPYISLARNEDYATSPVQLVLGLLVSIFLVFFFKTPHLVRLFAALGVSLVLLNAIVWKWNDWGNRFLLQAMVILAIPLAFALWRGLSTGRPMRKVTAPISVLLISATCLYGLFVSLTIQYRPILDPANVLNTPREYRYFTVVGKGQLTAIEGARPFFATLPNDTTVGLRLGSGIDEYPVWALLNMDSRLKFEILGSNNETTIYETEIVDVDVCLSLSELTIIPGNSSSMDSECQ